MGHDPGRFLISRSLGLLNALPANSLPKRQETPNNHPPGGRLIKFGPYPGRTGVGQTPGHPGGFQKQW